MEGTKDTLYHRPVLEENTSRPCVWEASTAAASHGSAKRKERESPSPNLFRSAVSLRPLGPPVGDHRREHARIPAPVGSNPEVGGVGLALVPHRTSDGHVEKRRLRHEHAAY